MGNKLNCLFFRSLNKYRNEAARLLISTLQCFLNTLGFHWWRCEEGSTDGVRQAVGKITLENIRGKNPWEVHCSAARLQEDDLGGGKKVLTSPMTSNRYQSYCWKYQWDSIEHQRRLCFAQGCCGACGGRGQETVGATRRHSRRDDERRT